MKEKNKDCCFNEEFVDFDFEVNNHPIIGEEIYDHELEVYHEDKIKRVKLSDYRGKWMVIFFYPADFTFVCPTELEQLAENHDKFKKLNTEVISVSTDTVFTHKGWHDQSKAIAKIKFPMAADPTGRLTKDMGVYIPNEGLALRGTFIIDPDGVLRAYEVHDNNIGRSIDELLRKLQAAQFTREHGGEVCPVNWKPGGKTLKPGLDLGGQI